jgi:hypothetical protein
LNGILVASAQDATYESGDHHIGATVSPGGTSEACLSHLVVTQQ